MEKSCHLIGLLLVAMVMLSNTILMDKGLSSFSFSIHLDLETI
jgi:hypothetical protein